MKTKCIFVLLSIMFFIPIENFAKRNPINIIANVVALDGWEYNDENISVKYSIIIMEYENKFVFPEMSIEVENKSSEFVYLDLGKSFIIRNGNAEPFWVETKSSYTDGGNTNVNVSVGTIANILGVGGKVGELANGLTIGGGNSSHVTTTKSSPRVEPLPPLSKKEIRTLLYKDGCYGDDIYIKPRYLLKNTKNVIFTNINVPIGETFDYNMNDSPISFHGLINYSLKESCESSKNIINKFYVNKLIGLKYQVNYSYKSPGEIKSLGYKLWDRQGHFYMYYRKKK